MIKVLLIDDSPLALKTLEKVFSSATDINVVGKVFSASESLEIIPLVSPDVICLDLHMPNMNGLELTKEILQKFPLPILVCSVSVYPEDKDNVFNLLEAGAIDVIPKPRALHDAGYQKIAEELISKVRIASKVRVVRRIFPEKKAVFVSGKRGDFAVKGYKNARIIAIGASTGGPQTLEPIFSQLPVNFPLPIVCIQHISEDFQKSFVSWLAGQCKIKIKVASPGDIPLAGTIYFPDKSANLIIDNAGRFRFSAGSDKELYLPSVNVTFSSISSHYGAHAMGIILTGMGNDGADGLSKINQAGGIAIAQNEESCVVYGMPKAAIESGAARYILTPAEIIQLLLQL